MAKNYILNVKDTNGNWVPLQTLVGPKGDQGVQGSVGVGIKSITKENENLIITLTNDQRKELDLNITNTLNTIFSNRISQEINDKLSKVNITSDIIAETLKRDIDLNSGKIRNNELSLTKTANELKIENNIIKYKENNVNKTIDLTPYINPTNQAIESIVQSKGQTLFEPIINKKSGFNLEKTDELNVNDSNKLSTAKGIKRLYDWVIEKFNTLKISWNNVENKPLKYEPIEHDHNSLYFTKNETNSAIEQNMLQTTGKAFGGNIQTPGEKVSGKTYFDTNTQKLYLCTRNNTDISPNVNNFKPIDNNTISERLENLITLEKGEGNFETNIGGLILKVYAYPSKTGLNRYNFYTAFPNKCLVCILSENDGINNTEPALEAFDKNGFKTNNIIGTGQFFCTAIGY